MAKRKTTSTAIVVDPGVTRMHSEHRQWQSEHGLWRDELRVWQEELKQIAKDLKKLGTAVAAREKMLRTHAAAVRLDDQTLAKHEHSLAASLQGKEAVDLAALGKAHRAQKAKQTARSREHAALKRQQQRLATSWQTLLKALG